MPCREAGFTLVELMIALVVLSLLSLALYGVVTIGATSAGAGERKTEQARRYRVATGVILRQLRSAAPVYVAYDDEESEPYFIGARDHLAYATASPQGPYSAGLALVSYWLEDGVFMMSETPYFLAYDEDGLKDDADALRLETALLYDVKEVVFEYQRSDYESDEWESDWDAVDGDTLPAAVRFSVEFETPDYPALQYQVPLFVGTFNEITGEDDFRRRGRRAPSLASADEEEPQPDDDADDDENDDLEDDEDF